MAKNKTAATANSLTDFIDKLVGETKKEDSHKLIEIFKKLTGFDPVLWGPSIIGFGTHHYKYESGHEGDMPLACFSPRKNAIVLYLSLSFAGSAELLKKLGKHKQSKGCVYVNKLEDIDTEVLKKIIVASMNNVKKVYHS
jgi:hypothetical protein